MFCLLGLKSAEDTGDFSDIVPKLKNFLKLVKGNSKVSVGNVFFPPISFCSNTRPTRGDPYWTSIENCLKTERFVLYK